MAKLKTKKIGFDRLATETDTNVWEWTVGEITWRFSLGMGLNTRIVHSHTDVGVCYCKNLECAAYFAEGYKSGMLVGDHTP